MKLLLKQPIYSLSNHQERIEFFPKNPNCSLTLQTIRSVLENQFFSNLKNIDDYCSSLSKRIEIYSLSNQLALTRANFAEEQSDSLDYENTYFHSEETSKFDDSFSLTTITSNLTKKCHVMSKDISIYSDTEDNSDANHWMKINSYLPNVNMDFSDEEISTSSKSNLFELIPFKTSSITRQTLSNDDLVNQSSEQHNTIRSSVDTLSLNSSLTSSLASIVKQLNQQEEKQTNADDDGEEYDIIVNDQNSLQPFTMINDNEEEEFLDSTKLYDNGQHDGIHSDESQYSDDFRYSSHAIQNSCISDEINNTSSTLRQEAISLTRVRCKQRQAWFDSSKFISHSQVGGTDALASSSRKTNMNSTRSAMSLRKHSLECNENENTNVETPSDDFLELNSDHCIDESMLSPLLKTSNTHNKDASSSKTKNFYLIHHQSSLIPIKNLFNQDLNTNIELIQMDEQECILEIVDGVVTLVPKEKSRAVNNDEENSEEEEEERNSSEDETSNPEDSPRPEKRSSSIASSISTPPISKHERKRAQASSPSSPSSSSSRSSSQKEQAQEPFILLRDIPSKSPPVQTEQSVDLLDLFSTPPVPSSNSNSNEKNDKNLLDDSLSSVSSYEQNSHSSEKEKAPSSSPIQNQSKPSSLAASIQDDLSQTKKSPVKEETEVEYTIPKSEPPPAAKPINKIRINEFASLLSGSVHLNPPQINKKSETLKTNPAPSPSRSEDQSYSSIRSAPSDRDERESFHTVKSHPNSDFEQTKKHIDARYNEKIDDRKSIQINTSNIKALFEQKISDTNKALSQSNEHLAHLTETRQQHQQHKKAPISYPGGNRNLQVNSQPTNRRQSHQDSAAMNKYSEHIGGTKEVVIEEKKPEHTHQSQQYGSVRRNNTEEILRPGVDSLTNSPETNPNGYYSESLIAREIRETKEKEEELRQQRKKCGLPEDVSSVTNTPNNTQPVKSDPGSKQPVKSSSFLSNLGFFTSKANESNSSRRSTIAIHNVIYDSQVTSSSEERRPSVSQETNRLNDQSVPIIRTGSTNSYIHRSSSNQNLAAAQNTNNIIQREIEAIRAKETELRQLGRIQRTSDEHSDPRKYQELVPPVPKSQSTNTLPSGKPRRETERMQGPMTATANGFLKPKPISNSSSMSSVRGRFPSPNPTAPIVSSANKTTDYSKLSSTDRLELEKRECQEREQELRKQRHSITSGILSGNSTMNGDSGNASQDEHDDDQERYFEKMERLKRTENEKAQAPLVRPTKKSNLSEKWEQMVANKTNNPTDDDEDDVDKF